MIWDNESGMFILIALRKAFDRLLNPHVCGAQELVPSGRWTWNVKESRYANPYMQVKWLKWANEIKEILISQNWFGRNQRRWWWDAPWTMLLKLIAVREWCREVFRYGWHLIERKQLSFIDGKNDCRVHVGYSIGVCVKMKIQSHRARWVCQCRAFTKIVKQCVNLGTLCAWNLNLSICWVLPIFDVKKREVGKFWSECVWQYGIVQKNHNK